MAETPSYIKTLLIPNGRKAPGRKVWSIDLEQTWLPFFLATNTAGETHISSEALGAPLTLAYNSDRTVKFSKMGRPVFRVEKELSDKVKMVRENFAASLASYAKQVYQANPDGYKAEVSKAQEAGKPIMARDRQAIDEALTTVLERAMHGLAERKPERGQFNATAKDAYYAQQPQYYLLGLGVSGLTFRAFAKVRLASSYVNLFVDIAGPLKSASVLSGY